MVRQTKQGIKNKNIKLYIRMPLRSRIGKTRRQIRRENRGWTFSSSSSPRPRTTMRNSSPRHIRNYAPFRKTSSSTHSAWRTVSSKGRGPRRSVKTRKSRK